jgi:hypothetical protein
MRWLISGGFIRSTVSLTRGALCLILVQERPLRAFPYDAQDVIYDDMFKRLASAISVLDGYAGQNVFGDYDLIYKGDVNKWKKFANTLRLRLAIRISGVDAGRAKTEGEAAAASGTINYKSWR